MHSSLDAAPPRPLRRDAERDREQILRSARMLLADRGLDVTLHDIAREARVGVATVYRRFRNLDELLDELFDEGLERIRTISHDALEFTDPWEGFVYYLRGAVQMMSEDRGLWALSIRGPSKKRHLRDGRTQFWSDIPQLLERAHRSGQLRPDIGPTDVPVINSMLATAARFTSGGRADASQRYLELMLDALRADRPATATLPVEPLTPSELDDALSQWY